MKNLLANVIMVRLMSLVAASLTEDDLCKATTAYTLITVKVLAYATDKLQ